MKKIKSWLVKYLIGVYLKTVKLVINMTLAKVRKKILEKIFRILQYHCKENLIFMYINAL